MPAISLIAYDAQDGDVFVSVPNEQGRWVKTHPSVLNHECKICGALKGEPCFTVRHRFKAYTCGTHHTRRDLFKRAMRQL